MFSGGLLEHVTYSQSTFLFIPNYTTNVSEIRTASSYYNSLHAKPYLGLGRYTPACVFFSLQRHRGLVQEQFLPLNASGYSYLLNPFC